MIKRKIKLTIPQYRERKEIFDAIGYKEVAYVEKRYYAYVTQEIDETMPHYHELRNLEKNIYVKGPTFTPIILLVVVAFALLSVFVILLAEQKGEFDLYTNAFSFLLPAFLCMLLDVIYTYFYFTINKRIIDRGFPNKAEIINSINKIKEGAQKTDK